MGLFSVYDSPVAIYQGEKQGVSGLISLSLDTEKGEFPVAIIMVNGEKAANAQIVANLNSEAYYTVFGDKLSITNITCVDVPTVCKDSTPPKGLKDVVVELDEAIENGALPIATVLYGSTKIEGYLTSISFEATQQYKSVMVLTIQGYVS